MKQEDKKEAAALVEEIKAFEAKQIEQENALLTKIEKYFEKKALEDAKVSQGSIASIIGSLIANNAKSGVMFIDPESGEKEICKKPEDYKPNILVTPTYKDTAYTSECDVVISLGCGNIANRHGDSSNTIASLLREAADIVDKQGKEPVKGKKPEGSIFTVIDKHIAEDAMVKCIESKCEPDECVADIAARCGYKVDDLSSISVTSYNESLTSDENKNERAYFSYEYINDYILRSGIAGKKRNKKSLKVTSRVYELVDDGLGLVMCDGTSVPLSVKVAYNDATCYNYRKPDYFTAAKHTWDEENGIFKIVFLSYWY